MFKKKNIFLFSIICICLLSAVFASDFPLLSKKEQVEADMVTITSADILNVVHEKAIHLFIYFAIAAVFFYCTLILVHLKVYPLDSLVKRLHGYIKYCPHIARITAGFGLIIFSSLDVFAAHNLRIFLMIFGVMILLGFLSYIVSLLGGILFLFIVFESEASVLSHLEVFGLLSFMAVYPLIHPGVDSLFKYKFKKLPVDPFLMLRITLGVSFIYSGLTNFITPKYNVMLINKIPILANLPVAPEATLLFLSLVEVALGIFLVIGFLTRLHSAALWLRNLALLFLLNSKGLVLVPVIGSALILSIAGAEKYSLDNYLKKKHAK